MRAGRFNLFIAVLVTMAACSGKRRPVTRSARTEVSMKERVAKFVECSVGVEESKIKAEHRPVLIKLIEAAKLIDELYLRQVSKENPRLRAEIEKTGSASTLAYFDIMYGPWDRLDQDKPFFGDKAKPLGATFYPENLSRREFEKWLTAHPNDKAAFESYFTVIGRTSSGLTAVPYSEAYQSFLEPAAALLKEAASLAEDKRLAAYLSSRAGAFSSNEYRQSDIDWMDLGDGALEVVIGPYEVYEDRLMGLKAAFEAFITLRQPEDSKALSEIKKAIPEMEAFLPIPDEHKNPSRGTDSPISVVDVLFAAGDARAGVQTLAFNLPNDEVIREKKGSKKVLLKNVAEAKFKKILMPIADRLVRQSQLRNITFDAFFHHTLVHETAHGLGPGRITVKGDDGKTQETTVNQALKDLYSVIEEAKADVLGIVLNYLLIEKGMRPRDFEEEMYASFLGGFFRSVRFGAEEAHGKANLIQFNYLVEKGAVVRDPDGRYGTDSTKMRDALTSLARDLLMLEALGDYDGADGFIAKYGVMPEELKTALSGLKDIATDIVPRYTVLEQMKNWE
jgi:hypothetical protein